MTSHKPAANHPWRNSDLPSSRQPLPPRPYRRVGRAPQPRPRPPAGWWPCQRAASALEVTTTEVNRLCRRGTLAGVVVGRVRYVDPASVRAYREARAKLRLEMPERHMLRSHANNHGWPIAEAARKMRGG